MPLLLELHVTTFLHSTCDDIMSDSHQKPAGIPKHYCSPRPAAHTSCCWKNLAPLCHLKYVCTRCYMTHLFLEADASEPYSSEVPRYPLQILGSCDQSPILVVWGAIP